MATIYWVLPERKDLCEALGMCRVILSSQKNKICEADAVGSLLYIRGQRG